MNLLKKLIFLLAIGSLLFISGCNNSDDETVLGDWVKIGSYDGSWRASAVNFVIGDRAYLGLGYNNANSKDEYLLDMYSYSLSDGFWTKMTSFPGIGREYAVSFSVGGKAYVVGGQNTNLTTEELSDVWQYDPEDHTDGPGGTWTLLPDAFPGGPRFSALSFVIGDKAYVGTGSDGDQDKNDMYEFDYSQVELDQNPWKQVKTYPGDKIQAGLGFTIGNKGFVCTGRTSGSLNLDMWEFDPTGEGNGTWTSREVDTDDSDYSAYKAAVNRSYASVIVKGTKAYIIGGIVSAADKTVYEFNSDTDGWEQKTSFEGFSRSRAVAFSLGDRMFYGTGYNGSSYYYDFWEFNPALDYDESDSKWSE